MSSFVERCEEIDRWYEENPNPSSYELAGRLIPKAARRMIRNEENTPGLYAFTGVDELTEFAGVLHELWIPEAITLRQAAQIAIPAVYDILAEQDRMPEMKAWVQECFFDHGLEPETARNILKAHQQESAA